MSTKSSIRDAVSETPKADRLGNNTKSITPPHLTLTELGKNALNDTEYKALPVFYSVVRVSVRVLNIPLTITEPQNACILASVIVKGM